MNKFYLLLMVLITITNITTEITLNIALWIFKKTLYGTYYIGNYLLSNNEYKYNQTDIDILHLCTFKTQTF